AGTPVDDAAATIDVALVGKVCEEAHHGARVGVVHGEPMAAVVERGTHRAKLVHDLAAVVSDELPALLHKCSSSKLAVVDSVGREPTHQHALQRDPRVVVARLPEAVEPAH